MTIDGRPCPFCGGTAFEWGRVPTASLKFVANDAGFLNSMRVGNRMSARKCSTCGNVQLFEPPEE